MAPPTAKSSDTGVFVPQLVSHIVAGNHHAILGSVTRDHLALSFVENLDHQAVVHHAIDENMFPVQRHELGNHLTALPVSVQRREAVEPECGDIDAALHIALLIAPAIVKSVFGMLLTDIFSAVVEPKLILDAYGRFGLGDKAAIPVWRINDGEERFPRRDPLPGAEIPIAAPGKLAVRNGVSGPAARL